jgi:5-methylcytosine-specific restriction endonuclease McrA
MNKLTKKDAPPESKTCSLCGCEKPLDDFSKDKRKKHGVSSWCKSCKRSRVQERRASDPERARELGRLADAKPQRKAKKQEWVEKNKDKVAAIQKRHTSSAKHKEWYAKWAEENKEKIKENQRRYNERHPQRVRDQSSRWLKRNPEKNADKSHRRRARARGVYSEAINKEELIKVRSGCCVFCGSKEDITVDHIIPISRGGPHVLSNLQPLCMSCNCAKRDMTMDEFITKQQESRSAAR